MRVSPQQRPCGVPQSRTQLEFHEHYYLLAGMRSVPQWSRNDYRKQVGSSITASIEEIILRTLVLKNCPQQRYFVVKMD